MESIEGCGFLELERVPLFLICVVKIKKSPKTLYLLDFMAETRGLQSPYLIMVKRHFEILYINEYTKEINFIFRKL